MAQIVKVTGYMIFPDDGAYEECKDIETFAREMLSSRFDCIQAPFETEIADIGEWNDNHELNYINKSKETCEKYFSNLPSQKSENNTNPRSKNKIQRDL